MPRYVPLINEIFITCSDRVHYQKWLSIELSRARNGLVYRHIPYKNTEEEYKEQCIKACLIKHVAMCLNDEFGEKIKLSKMPFYSTSL